jgi:hypothetical protein
MPVGTAAPPGQVPSAAAPLPPVAGLPPAAGRPARAPWGVGPDESVLGAPGSPRLVPVLVPGSPVPLTAGREPVDVAPPPGDFPASPPGPVLPPVATPAPAPRPVGTPRPAPAAGPDTPLLVPVTPAPAAPAPASAEPAVLVTVTATTAPTPVPPPPAGGAVARGLAPAGAPAAPATPPPDTPRLVPVTPSPAAPPAPVAAGSGSPALVPVTPSAGPAPVTPTAGLVPVPVEPALWRAVPEASPAFPPAGQPPAEVAARPAPDNAHPLPPVRSPGPATRSGTASRPAEPNLAGPPAADGAGSTPQPSGAGLGRPLAVGSGPRGPVTLPLAALRRHTVVFGGSGSGKTALARRLVEECALRGVSSVVLDATGELARLGDPWPSPPAGWARGDAELAREYLATVEVTVWTPGRVDGRPLPLRCPAAGEEPEPDVDRLLTPAPGRRARVSVVSLVGLPTDEARQEVADGVLRGLLTWARSHPLADGPPRALFVLDEAQAFAGAGGATEAGRDAVALAAEAGAAGLGLVFATQSPTWLPQQITAGAATRLFGRLNALAQVDAARRMAAALGGDAAEIGRLGVGEFYVSGDGIPFQRLTAPLCLTHHPGWPPHPDDVVARARPR